MRRLSSSPVHRSATERGSALAGPALALLTMCTACGGGPPPLAALHPAARVGICTPLAEQAAGPFGCRATELTGGMHGHAGAAQTFSVDVEFGPNGRVAQFRRLRPVSGLTDGASRAPECVATSVRALRIPEDLAPVSIALVLRYVPGGVTSATIRDDGVCQLTLPPGGL